MRPKTLIVVTLAALAAAAAVTLPGCTRNAPEPAPAPAPAPPPAAETPVEAPPDLDGPPPPEDFAEQLATEREGALIDDARERAMEAAREEELERLENLKREQAAAAPNGEALRSLTRAETTEQRAKQFESEPADRDWAPGAEAEILERMSQTGVDAVNVRVECRTTLCRLEVVQRANEPEGSVPIGVALLQLSDLQPSPATQSEGAGGTHVTVSYLARR